MIMGLDHQQIKTSDDDQHLKENANNALSAQYI
jgi:hypothetical protein